MAKQNQNSNTPIEGLDEQVEAVEVQESETFADNSVDLDEAMSPEAKAAKKHIEDLAKKNNKSFGDQRMHIDDFPGKHDRKTQAAAKALNKHQYGEEVEQVDEVDKGFGQRMKAADAAANIYSKEKRKPDNREIDKIRAKYRDQKKNQSQSEEARKVNELSKSTLGSYVKKASQSAADHGAETGRKQSDRDSVQRSLNRHGMSDADKDAAHKAYKTTPADVTKPEKKVAKRLKGINTAVKKLTNEEEQNCGCGQNPCKTYGKVDEKTLTPAEKKKREEVAKAIERDNPKMPMDKKMAIATATAKKVAESSVSDRTKRLIERAINRKP